MSTQNEQNKQLEAMELQRKFQIQDVKEIVDLPAGKRWFKRLAKQAYIFSTTIDGKNSVLNEGKRCLAINCLVELALANREVCADIFTDLLEQEGINREEVNNE